MQCSNLLMSTSQSWDVMASATLQGLNRILKTLYRAMQHLHSHAAPALLSHGNTVVMLVQAYVYDDAAW